MDARWLPILLVGGGLAVTITTGCGVEARRERPHSKAAAGSYARDVEAGEKEESYFLTVQQSDGGDAQTRAATVGNKETRKIIYTTTVDLVVEDYSSFEEQIVTLAEQHDGFISQSHTDRRSGNEQTGTWTLRIPVTNYLAFLQGITSLGFAESRQEQAEDVTEEYVDLEARIKNKKQLEERIIELLDERTGKLADVLEIERELARVREEIERMEGRLRYLAERTSLATITIHCREEQHYTPPAAPTFASRLARSWSESLDSLVAFFENITIGAVAAAPWIGVLAIPLGLVTYGIRRRRRR